MRPLIPSLLHQRFRAAPWERLPAGIERCAARYIVNGFVLPPFMRAIAIGDLYEAHRVAPAADVSAILRCFEKMPAMCHGSLANVVGWEMIGGLDGIEHQLAKLPTIYDREGRPT